MATRLPVLGGHEQGFATTNRTDSWWANPLVVFLGLTAFIVYANFALFQAQHYYASPTQPLLFSGSLQRDRPGRRGSAHHELVRRVAFWWPAFIRRPQRCSS